MPKRSNWRNCRGPMELPIGAIVGLEAVDWAVVEAQVSLDCPFAPLTARLYGEVVRCTDTFVTIAPQVFADESKSVRFALTVPWPAVQKTILYEATASEGES